MDLFFYERRHRNMEVSGNQTLLDRNQIKIPSYSIKKELTVHLYNMYIYIFGSGWILQAIEYQGTCWWKEK